MKKSSCSHHKAPTHLTLNISTFDSEPQNQSSLPPSLTTNQSDYLKITGLPRWCCGPGVCLPMQGCRFNPWSDRFSHEPWSKRSRCASTTEPALQGLRSAIRGTTATRSPRSTVDSSPNPLPPESQAKQQRPGAARNT